MCAPKAPKIEPDQRAINERVRENLKIGQQPLQAIKLAPDKNRVTASSFRLGAS